MTNMQAKRRAHFKKSKRKLGDLETYKKFTSQTDNFVIEINVPRSAEKNNLFFLKQSLKAKN